MNKLQELRDQIKALTDETERKELTRERLSENNSLNEILPEYLVR